MIAMSRATRQVSLMARRRHLDALAASLAGGPVRAQTRPSNDRLAGVIAGPHRSAANRARGRWRHPLETLRFPGIDPAQTVIEVTSGAGGSTEILAPFLRGSGRLVAAHDSRTDTSEYRRRSRAVFDAFLAAQPDLYDRVATVTLPTGPRFSEPGLPKAVDAVLTFRNVHNWPTDVRL